MSVDSLTLGDTVCFVLRCYVTLRIAQRHPCFDWDAFVADVFGVHGDERAIMNGVRHLKQIYGRCSGFFDPFLHTTFESAVSELEELAAAKQRTHDTDVAMDFPPTSKCLSHLRLH